MGLLKGEWVLLGFFGVLVYGVFFGWELQYFGLLGVAGGVLLRWYLLGFF